MDVRLKSSDSTCAERQAASLPLRSLVNVKKEFTTSMSKVITSDIDVVSFQRLGRKRTIHATPLKTMSSIVERQLNPSIPTVCLYVRAVLAQPIASYVDGDGA